MTKQTEKHIIFAQQASPTRTIPIPASIPSRPTDRAVSCNNRAVYFVCCLFAAWDSLCTLPPPATEPAVHAWTCWWRRAHVADVKHRCRGGIRCSPHLRWSRASYEYTGGKNSRGTNGIADFSFRLDPGPSRIGLYPCMTYWNVLAVWAVDFNRLQVSKIYFFFTKKIKIVPLYSIRAREFRSWSRHCAVGS